MPDKIFLNKHMLRRGMLYPAQYPADVPEFEYIRKEALTEWLKSELENGGPTTLVQHIINRINSL